MISLQQASAIAQSAVKRGQTVDSESARETKQGWYFPYVPGESLAGSVGVIVHKSTGKPLVLGSAYGAERDIAAFDAGFQYERYDLVIIKVIDPIATLRILLAVGPTITIPQYDSGQVWRVPRKMKRSQIEEHIRELPAIFPDMQLYFGVEPLLEARAKNYFVFEALEYRRAETAE